MKSPLSCRVAKTSASIAALVLMLGTAWADEVLDEISSFDIPDQPLDQALLAFSKQADVQIVMAADTTRDLEAAGIRGEQSNRHALERLLADRGLRYTEHSNRTIAVHQTAASEEVTSDLGNSRTKPILMAQNQTPAEENQTASTKSDDDEEEELELERVTVTGTNIRGVQNTASPMFVFDREDIDAAGYATAHEVVRTLPQNFGGGPSETGRAAVTNANDANLNNGAGVGVNLRGLGSDSTLVLLNGRRMAPAGLGSFADVSFIPIGAIERIDVLLDGASSIYGSDAVGGVFNFVLRDDYEGAETRVRYGTVTDGGRDEVLLGQTFGKNWTSGRALINLEYFDVSPLDTSDRSFTRDTLDPFTLMPEQERKSAFFTASQELAERFKLFGDALYSARDSGSVGTLPTQMNTSSIDTEQIGGTLGTGIEWGTWYGELTGAFSRNTTDSVTEIVTIPDPDNPLQGESRTLDSSVEATTWSVDAKADGSVFQIPGGDIKLAVGGHYRQEMYEDDGRDTDEDRDIFAIFGEVFLPIVGKENRVAGIERLELTGSVRHEEYSDFGTSTDPKVGVLWSPLNGLNLRATWGTSFRAPLFREITVTFLQGLLADLPDPSSPTGTTLTAAAFGENADLQPEEATTVTAGIDYQPNFMPNLNIGLTYFNIDFDDRIERIFGFFELHTDPLFASLIDRNPDPAFLALLSSQPFSFNFSESEFTDAEALFDLRLRNLAGTDTAGLDLSVSYGLDTDIGQWNFTLNGAYLRKNDFQITKSAEPIERLNSVSNPIDLKLRGGVSWRRNRLAANLFVNYTDSYEDIRFDPALDVDSWTTVDVNLRYSTEGAGEGLLDDTVFALIFHNLLDEDPPFVNSFFTNRDINFDSDNASALGRFISLQITKQW